MNNFPSIKVYIITFVFLIGYLTIDFFSNSKKNFFQLNYNWSGVKEIKTINNVEMDSVASNYLGLSTTLNSKKIQLDPQNTFLINNTYYFRCNSIKFNENKILFKGGFWINSIPERITKPISFKEVDLQLIQEGNISVCMIGDSQLTYKTGKFTRRALHSKLKNIKFVGNTKDLYGYPYSATTLNNTKNVLETFDSIPNTDIYVLFLGAHEKDLKKLNDNLRSIVDKLLKTNKKLILITPTRYTNPNKLGVYEALNNLYNGYSHLANVEVINLFESSEQPSQILLKDGVHLNKEGHQLLTRILTEQLKKYNVR